MKTNRLNLQYNLIRSHSAGAGEKIPDLYVKAAMLVRLLSIMQGKSGIHPSCVTLLQSLILNDVYPLIPEHGGVGASGDLVQLSHMALILIGEGEVTYQGVIRPTAEVFSRTGTGTNQGGSEGGLVPDQWDLGDDRHWNYQRD